MTMTKEEWGQAHFRFAQSPMSWLLTAETLIDAATQTYFTAAEQAEKFEAASQAATEKATIALDGSCNRIILAVRDGLLCQDRHFSRFTLAVGVQPQPCHWSWACRVWCGCA
jgi:hypothetical protein